MKKLSKIACDYVLGGYENAMQDGHIKKYPSKKELYSEVEKEFLLLLELNKQVKFNGKQELNKTLKAVFEKEYKSLNIK